MKVNSLYLISKIPYIVLSLLILIIYFNLHKFHVYNEDYHLKYFYVWSHRINFEGYDEGSREATSSALNHGIYHFDIDIIYDESSYDFYVSHPSRFNKSYIYSYQTLIQFLDLVSLTISNVEILKSETLISIEPKFKEHELMKLLIQKINNHILAKHCAITVRFLNHIQIVNIYGPKLSIAIPLRSKNLLSGELWNYETKKLSKFYTKNKILIMPDILILRENPNLLESLKVISKYFIVWMIDSDEDFDYAINNNLITGIITNYPAKFSNS